jgi:hypothetical protein
MGERLMGLDITAYSHLQALGLHHDVDGGWCPDEDHITAYAYADFPASFRGLEILGKENEGRAHGMILGGCYIETDKSDVHRFHAGSYSAYNAWRDDLRRQFNPDTEPDLPFYELIWFADNEGCIGEIAAAELLNDFRTYAAMYNPGRKYPDYMQQKYVAWQRAFELAAEGGLVDFH